MIFNVNIGSTFNGPSGTDTPWKIDSSRRGNYFFERPDIKCRIQIPLFKEDSKFIATKIGDGYLTPPNTKFETYTSTLSPFFANNRTKEESPEIVYVTLDSSVKLIQYKSPYDIRYTYRGRPGKNGISPYQGCVCLVPDMIEYKDTPMFELIVKNLEENKYHSIKVLLDIEHSQIRVNDYPVNNQRMINVFDKIDQDKKRPRFKIQIKNGSPVLTHMWVVDSDEKEDMVYELLEYSLHPKVYENRTYVLNTQSMDEATITNLFKRHIDKTNDRCFTMVDDARIPYPLWKETKQLYVFRYNSENGFLSCLKSI